MSYLFLIVKERENDKKEIVTESSYIEATDIFDVFQYAREGMGGFDDEVIKIERLVPICARIEPRTP